MHLLKKLQILPVFILIFCCSCNDNRPYTIKDLDENMIDLMAYQENMGDELKKGQLMDAAWLVDGMDSVLHEVSRKFDEHRKLKEPFSYYYTYRMKKPIRLIRTGIRDKDTAVAIKGYRMLVRNCNSCHIDLDIGKQVIY